jgi:ABC-type phosphate/phosphonate transport system substrate-binding protein
MAMAKAKPVPVSETLGASGSRRHAFALMLAACRWLPGALSAADGGAPVRLAISQSVMGDVNLNDARSAMQIWLNRLAQEANVVIDLKLIDTQAILDCARRGQVDALALNVVEYRQIADLLDSSQIVTAPGEAGQEQYLILTKKNSGIRQLGDLKSRRVCALKTPRMCLAPAWLFTILAEGHFGFAEQFFGSMAPDAKVSRVVLPVFFGQAEACLTSKRGFDTMCELNPQVARDLTVLASSPPMVVNFYIFRKNYQGVNREKVIRAMSSLHSSPAGRQLETLFQFENLGVRDASCLASALGVLEKADRAGSRSGAERVR